MTGRENGYIGSRRGWTTPRVRMRRTLPRTLTLHALILSSLQQEPIFTAEQVLEEIDEIMQENVPAEEVPSADSSPEKADDDAITKNAISSLVYGERLKTLSAPELTEVLVELERLIREHSETLIQELALRDELEFEKELKNSFISLLLSVQNKRRHFHIDRRKGRPASVTSHNGPEPKYLTTVIPYNVDKGPPSNASLQILIKILHAINDDSPTVPTLLTDYILKGFLVPFSLDESLSALNGSQETPSGLGRDAIKQKSADLRILFSVSPYDQPQRVL
ncbi:hypothetical protein HPB47_010529 [Ixodes persulcatus]|uniref:Uncharacterized protein n=1 Tax=Ixodes persulcatus TaxID=34615 RepID=A0AC60NZ30_IXOPE|nr:hypothetical protein HPB47_010529 [Ixodes persulcatus]